MFCYICMLVVSGHNAEHTESKTRYTKISKNIFNVCLSEADVHVSVALDAAFVTASQAVLAHVAGLRSEQGSLQKASRIPFPRIATNEMRQQPGESPEDLSRWKWLWKQLCNELDRVHLWPSWEPQVS